MRAEDVPGGSGEVKREPVGGRIARMILRQFLY
jgi:hypothetical protein